MRHRNSKRILGRNRSHRKMLIKNLLKSFFINGKIKTTAVKAKAVKPIIEKLITIGKKNNLTSRRIIIKKIGSNVLANKILNDISPKYVERKGGYTRILKLGIRSGDGSKVVVLTLV